MGFIFKDESAASNPRVARIWAAVFYCIIGFLALVGLLALVLLAHDELVSHFSMPRQMAMGLLSAAIVCGGLILLVIGVKQKKEAIRAVATKGEDDREPWLKRPDWAEGRLRSTSRKPVMLLWIIVLFWCAISFVISALIILSQLRTGNPAMLWTLAVIVGLVMLVALVFAGRTTLAWRRFRKSIFTPVTVPVASGGALQGEILVPGGLRPAHGWHVALSCIQRKTTGKTNNLKTVEKTLWRDEKWLKADLPEKIQGAISLPIYFQLPADRPEATPEKGDGVHWKLEAWAEMEGPNFDAAFEVPVFKASEAQAAADDPTLAYQVSLDEIRKQIDSQIEIVESLESKEFLFPSGRTPGFAVGATILCAVWTVIVIFLALKQAPTLVPVIFGAMDLLMLLFVLDLWFRRSHVAIKGGTIKIETAWPVYKQEESVKVSDAAAFYAEAGTPVGHTTYYDLKLRTRDGKEWVLAKNLGHKPEADWLARQMTEAAKNAKTA